MVSFTRILWGLTLATTLFLGLEFGKVALAQATITEDILRNPTDVAQFALTWDRVKMRRRFAKAAEDQIKQLSDGSIDITHCYPAVRVPNEVKTNDDNNKLVDIILVYAESYYLNFHLLKLAGYPNSTWESDLLRMYYKTVEFGVNAARRGTLVDVTQSDIRNNISTIESALVTKLDSVRARDTSLPKIYVRDADGCGGDYNPMLKIAITGGELYLITEFQYRLCERRNGSPNERTKCSWSQVPPGVTVPVGGIYYYSVDWADGTTKPPTRIDLTRGTLEDKTVTIRKN